MSPTFVKEVKIIRLWLLKIIQILLVYCGMIFKIQRSRKNESKKKTAIISYSCILNNTLLVRTSLNISLCAHI